MKKISVAFLASLWMFACSSARMSEKEADQLFREGRYDEAAERLQKGYHEQGETSRDALLYLLDIGLALHSAGKYKESNAYFEKANKIAEIKDYTSLSTEAAAIITSENLTDYKGEDFEKVLINVYKAINYALMGQHEDSVVEARVVNRKIYMMVSQGQRKYQQSAFSHYLSGILYEADKDFNNAYVSYKNTQELAPNFPGLGKDLWRTAWLLKMSDEMARWQQTYGLSQQDLTNARSLNPRSPKGEIIVIYENGISPVKQPNPDFNRVPKFYPRSNPASAARVEVNGSVIGDTAPLDDIEVAAIKNLDQKYAGIIAKRLAGVVVKEAIAYGVEKETNSPLLGMLARVALHATDEADVRSWNLLPRDLQILRIPVDPGSYTVKLIPQPQGAAPPLPEKTVEVPKGKKVLVNFRFMP